MNRIELPGLTRPTKIKASHLERLAIDYVRQSHPQQVQRHRESAEVQARLQERALAWGWPAERILVLDGDQGRSGTSSVGRDDFAWLLSEIALGHVGLILCFQLNRLAREDEECCRLIKVCGAFDTLLADEDGLYHPHDFNDRMVLTMKGFMGAFELHQLQQRMQAGRLNRCRRGEWLGQTPPGYVVGTDRKLQFDPDEQVQEVMRLVLKQFEVLGAISALLRYLREHRIELPFRCTGGPKRGKLQWHAPHRETLRQIMRNPAYAGTYTWGRYATDPRRVQPGRRGVVASAVSQTSALWSSMTIIRRTFPGSNMRATSAASKSSVDMVRSLVQAQDSSDIGRSGGVRPVWVPYANALYSIAALRLPATYPRLRSTALSELGRRAIGALGE